MFTPSPTAAVVVIVTVVFSFVDVEHDAGILFALLLLEAAVTKIEFSICIDVARRLATTPARYCEQQRNDDDDVNDVVDGNGIDIAVEVEVEEEEF